MASAIAGVGVHLPGDARIGVPLAFSGIAAVIGACRVVRDLYSGPIFRMIGNVVLGFGSLALPSALIKIGFQKMTHMSPSEIEAQYETVSYVYAILLGIMCICGVVLLNRSFETPAQNDREPSSMKFP